MQYDLRKPLDILRILVALNVENVFDCTIITIFCLLSRNKWLLILAVYSVAKIVNALHVIPTLVMARKELEKILDNKEDISNEER